MGRRNLRRYKIIFYRVGVDAVIEFGEGPVWIPCEGKAAAFVFLEALKFLDKVEFELRAEPRAKLEGDILMGERSAITSRTGN